MDCNYKYMGTRNDNTRCYSTCFDRPKLFLHFIDLPFLEREGYALDTLSGLYFVYFINRPSSMSLSYLTLANDRITRTRSMRFVRVFRYFVAVKRAAVNISWKISSKAANTRSRYTNARAIRVPFERRKRECHERVRRRALRNRIGERRTRKMVVGEGRVVGAARPVRFVAGGWRGKIERGTGASHRAEQIRRSARV